MAQKGQTEGEARSGAIQPFQKCTLVLILKAPTPQRSQHRFLVPQECGTALPCEVGECAKVLCRKRKWSTPHCPALASPVSFSRQQRLSEAHKDSRGAHGGSKKIDVCMRFGESCSCAMCVAKGPMGHLGVSRDDNHSDLTFHGDLAEAPPVLQLQALPVLVQQEHLWAGQTHSSTPGALNRGRRGRAGGGNRPGTEWRWTCCVSHSATGTVGRTATVSLLRHTSIFEHAPSPLCTRSRQHLRVCPGARSYLSAANDGSRNSHAMFG